MAPDTRFMTGPSIGSMTIVGFAKALLPIIAGLQPDPGKPIGLAVLPLVANSPPKLQDFPIGPVSVPQRPPGTDFNKLIGKQHHSQPLTCSRMFDGNGRRCPNESVNFPGIHTPASDLMCYAAPCIAVALRTGLTCITAARVPWKMIRKSFGSSKRPWIRRCARSGIRGKIRLLPGTRSSPTTRSRGKWACLERERKVGEF